MITARKNQPYVPLCVKNILTDVNLIECSAESHGVYFRLLCILYMQKPCGEICLKQKDRQSYQQVKNFAIKLGRSMPFSVDVIESSINELVTEDVLEINGDTLSQKCICHE